MDCNEKEMFYGAETANGDWISSNYSEYNEFLGIGKPQGFLGLKKFFNTQGYQQSVAASQLGGGGKDYGISIGTPTSTNLDPIASIGLSPLPVAPIQGATKATVPTGFGSTSGLNLSSLLNDINKGLGIRQDTASTVLGGGGSAPVNAPIGSAPIDSSAIQAQQVLQQKQQEANKPNNTMLYVGLAGAGVLLITGFAYMASKGK
jgi:hypothetical protein